MLGNGEAPALITAVFLADRFALAGKRRGAVDCYVPLIVIVVHVESVAAARKKVVDYS